MSRTYPQSGDLTVYEDDYGQRSISSFRVGVSLHESVSLYRQILRSVKYGLLFIALTFIALFGFEIYARRPLHLLQYGLVGMSMCVFYLVLLSLAEHILFWQAFGLASLITAAMNGLYIATAFSSRSKGLVIGGMLVALYAILYTLLQMEEYGILVGTGLVLAVMGILMYMTRNLGPAHDQGDEAAPGPPAEGAVAEEPGPGI